jgi:hypothetical protein
MELIRTIFSSPNALPILSSIGTGFLLLLAAIGQAWGKRKELAPPSSKDVIVQSLTVADTQAITEWSKTLQQTNILLKDRSEFERKMLFEAECTNALLNDIKHILARPKRQEAID